MSDHTFVTYRMTKRCEQDLLKHGHGLERRDPIWIVAADVRPGEVRAILRRHGIRCVSAGSKRDMAPMPEVEWGTPVLPTFEGVRAALTEAFRRTQEQSA